MSGEYHSEHQCRAWEWSHTCFEGVIRVVMIVGNLNDQ